MRLIFIFVVFSWRIGFIFSLIINTSSLSPHSQAAEYIPNCLGLETASESKQQRTRFTSIHLISLPKFLTPNTKLLRWKKAALGDGGVYWDQRPKSLVAFNYALAEHISQRLSSQREQNCTDSCNSAVECAVISTCARFEILLSVQTNEALFETISEGITHHRIENLNREIIQAVAECLAVQVMELNWLRRISWLTRDDSKRISRDTYSRWIYYTDVERLQECTQFEIPLNRRLKSFIMLSSIIKCKTSSIEIQAFYLYPYNISNSCHYHHNRDENKI